MGEVYRARDTRLDRSVAVKVLPEHIAQREDLRIRFEREARAVASLNHPHICTLHDIGNQDGTAYYMVMELMEGETLAARIEKGAIPLEQAIGLATQIADALDRAHRAGVTHRDVKPQNVMLTRDGVKVLDFGLAKSAAGKPGPSEETITKALTTEGTVMGTPQYMAPEQFEGREADARSDLWAFGAFRAVWRPDGKELYWTSPHRMVMAATIDAQSGTVRPGKPASLFRLQQGLTFQVARDGRFLVRQSEGDAPPDSPLVVVQDWPARRGSSSFRNSAATRNSSTLTPDRAINARKVPLATKEWTGMERVAIAPGFVMTMWLPRCRATRQPSRSNARTTSRGRSGGTAGITPQLQLHALRPLVASLARRGPLGIREWRRGCSPQPHSPSFLGSRIQG